MMAESLDFRKFERKSHFDVPLPIRKVQRMPVGPVDDDEIDSGAETPPTNTMAFSLMTKKGNRPQVTFSIIRSSFPELLRTDIVPDSNYSAPFRFEFCHFDEEQARS